MEIAGLCLPLKPQKERSCGAISFGCVEYLQHMDGVSLCYKKDVVINLFRIGSCGDR